MRVSVTFNPFIITIHVGRSKERAFDYLVGCSCSSCSKQRELAMAKDIEDERRTSRFPPGGRGEPVICCRCGSAPDEEPTVRLRRPTHESDYYCDGCWCKHDDEME